MHVPGEFPALASSLSAIRHVVEACAAEAGATPAVTAAAVLAVNEAVTNAIVHGYDGGRDDGVVRVLAETEPGWLRVVVADRGSGLRPRRHSPGVGLGFALIAQLADELELREPDGGGLELRLGFRLDG